MNNSKKKLLLGQDIGVRITPQLQHRHVDIFVLGGTIAMDPIVFINTL